MLWYLQLNIAIGFFGFLAIAMAKLNLSSRQKLRLHSLFIVMAILALPLAHLVPEENYQYPQREILNAPMSYASQGVSVLHDRVAASLLGPVYSIESLSLVMSLIIFSIIFLLLWRTFKTLLEIKKTFLFKRVGSLKIMIAEKLVSPYSFSFLNQSFVIVPHFLLEDRDRFRIAIKHELQHLRTKDTLWVYLFELSISVCFFNPVLYFWKRQFLIDQEFACDETLIAQKKVSAQAYATCLLHVADTTAIHKIPFGATGMAWGAMKPQLLQRIIRMKKIKKETQRVFLSILTFSAIAFTGTVFALQVPSGELSLTELEEVVKPNDFMAFPVEANDQILTELNRFITNSKWRAFSKASLKSYKAYKTLIDERAKRYGLPEEIAAIAFIESGFENLVDRSTSISKSGAGMWQFIPGTARSYGLSVNTEVDERLVIPKATDAAMKYLASNKLLLEDLRLAIMAYYLGEYRVQKDISRFNSRDPWVLIEKANYKTPYLARVMAAAILLKYPSLLD